MLKAYVCLVSFKSNLLVSCLAKICSSHTWLCLSWCRHESLSNLSCEGEQPGSAGEEEEQEQPDCGDPSGELPRDYYWQVQGHILISQLLLASDRTKDGQPSFWKKSGEGLTLLEPHSVVGNLCLSFSLVVLEHPLPFRVFLVLYA